MTKSSKALARTGLVVVGTIMLSIASRLDWYKTFIPAQDIFVPELERYVQMPDLYLGVNPVPIVLLFLGYGFILCGCYLWTLLKNRHWAFMFWGLLPLWGLLGIALLRDKSNDLKRGAI